MIMLEKNILIGTAQTGEGDNGRWYRVHYLDLDYGTACVDYVSAECFNTVKNLNLPFGTKVLGFFSMNDRRKIVLNGIKSK